MAELLVRRGARPTIFDAIEAKEASLVTEMLHQTASLAHLTNQAGVPAAHLAVARSLDSSLAQMLEASEPLDPLAPIHGKRPTALTLSDCS